MLTFRELVVRLSGTLRPRRGDGELEDELRLHLELTAEEARRRGDSPDGATRAAQLRAGSISHAMDQLRDQRGLPWLEDARRDLRHALRTLANTPGFTAVAVLTLALGIGASTAIFSMLKVVVLRPLPYRDPQRLVVVWTDDVKRQLHETLVSYSLYSEWKERSQAFAELGFASLTPLTVTGMIDAERVDAARTSASTFSVLGASPLYGRPFSPEEDRRRDRVVLVIQGFAERRFGSVSAAVGRRLLLDGDPTEVIGVKNTLLPGTQQSSDVRFPRAASDQVMTSPASGSEPTRARFGPGGSRRSGAEPSPDHSAKRSGAQSRLRQER